MRALDGAGCGACCSQGGRGAGDEVSPTERSSAKLRVDAPKRPADRASAGAVREPIAIIGMSGRYPQARDA